MPWIVGRKSDSEIVERTSGPQWTLARLQAIIPTNKGGVVGGYSYFDCPESDFSKVIDGWAHTVQWANGEIVGLSFAEELAKPWVKLSSDKPFIANDGVDSVTITLEVWRPDLSSVMGSVQRTAFRVPIETPDGMRFVRINIVNGIGIATFKTAKAGRYTFPADSKRYGTMRIFNQLTVDVDDLTLLAQ